MTRRLIFLIPMCMGLLTGLTACQAGARDEVVSAVSLAAAAKVESVSEMPETKPRRAFNPLPEPTSSGPVLVEGSGDFTNPAPDRLSSANMGEIDISLSDASIAAAAEVILGEILGESYVITGQVEGAITLKSANPLSRAGVLALFRSALAAIGGELTYDGVLYQIAPQGSSATTPRHLVRRDGTGSVSVAELKHISAAEMARILTPMTDTGGILRVDQARNVLMLDGNADELSAFHDVIAVFDKDWMSGMSVLALPVRMATPETLTLELETLFGSASGGPAEGLIQFIPNERLSSVLAISARRDLLERAADWVRRLDQAPGASANQIEIYAVQNRTADELAIVLQTITRSGTDVSFDPFLPPDSNPMRVDETGVSSVISSAPMGEGPAIVVDESNNSLIIAGDASMRASLLKLARRLDVLPDQVLLEATIAEVSLKDQLRFGVQWFFEEGDGRTILARGADGSVASEFPGFSLVLDGTQGRVVLSALSSVTDVKVISSPSIMVLNNKAALLQVGDQVPVTTQSARSVLDQNAAIVNSVSFRDTGVILEVTPRVNAEGMVLLEIKQEVSDVVETTSSGIDSPTIRQRRIETIVAVSDTETLLLGGLIQDDTNDTVSGVPVLGNIPLIGNLFRTKGQNDERTELMILITPRVVRNRTEARLITEEYRRRIDAVEQLRDLIQ